MKRNIKKRVISLIMSLAMLVSIMPCFATTANAATSTANVKAITNLLPITTYAMPASGASKVYAYSDSSLKTKQSAYYINSYKEQIVIVGISNNGQAVQVKYLNGSGTAYRTKWFRTVDILGLSSLSISKKQASAAMTVYRMKSASAVTSYGSISKGSDICYGIGTRKVGSTTYYITIYKLSSAAKVNGVSVKYKMGLVNQSTYSKYMKDVSSSSKSTTTSTSFNPVWPCKNSKDISTMYYYWHSGSPSAHLCRSNKYNAFDITGGGLGDTIYSIESGTVVEKGYQSGGFGYYVVIKHSNGLYSLYGHLKSAAIVNKGDSVSRKQVIGYMGKTGDSTGVHLHFELYNPSNYSKVVNPWTTYYQGKVSVTVGGNSYKANSKYTNDSYAKAWCKWLKNNCTKNSSGDYVFKAS